MEWQPIETAPKDTRLLLWLDGWTSGYYDSFLKGWRIGDKGFAAYSEPSHWMLPTQPNAR